MAAIEFNMVQVLDPMTYDSRRALEEAMLFNYKTTTRTDYREPEMIIVKPTVYKEKPPREHASFPPPKYVGAMMDWKHHIPFNALYTPKDILQTHPLTPQKVFERVVDEQREEVQKTRPRLVMTTAVSLDDVTDQKARDVLMKAIYTTEMKEKMEEAAATSVSIKAPLPVFPAPANPVFLPKWKPPMVPKEWRMDSLSWDQKQLRSGVDATGHFWLRPEHAPTRCKICEETKIVNAHRRRLNRLERQKNTI